MIYNNLIISRLIKKSGGWIFEIVDLKKFYEFWNKKRWKILRLKEAYFYWWNNSVNQTTASNKYGYRYKQNISLQNRQLTKLGIVKISHPVIIKLYSGD